MVTTNVSQIHLVHEGTKARTIVHLGSEVRQSAREFTLERPGLPPVQVRVSQVDTETYGAPILFELLNNTEDELIIRSRPAEVVDGNQRAPLNQNDVVEIGDVIYHSELHMGGNYPRPTLQTAWKTVAGPVDDHNEDAVGVYRANWGNLFVIADGVGGAQSGEIISEYAVKSILYTFREQHRQHNDENWLDVLKTTYEDINREVRHFALMAGASAGCTLTTVILKGWDAYITHVGDSRLYLWNGISLRQITTDHMTLVAGNNRQVGVTQRAMLTKAIGKSDEIEPEQLALRLQPDDRLMLCSDGVYGHLHLEDMANLFRNSSTRAIPDNMIDAAIEHFTDDNLSVVVVRLMVGGLSRAEREPAPEPMERVYYGNQRKPRLRAIEELHTNYFVSPQDRLYLWSRKVRRRGALRWWIALAVILVLIVILVPMISSSTPPGGANSGALGGIATVRPSATLINTPIRPLTRVPTVTLTPNYTPTPSATPLPLTALATPAAALPATDDTAYNRAGDTPNYSEAFL